MALNLIFTVTNDLVFDQRMIRICSSLSHAGYRITLVGRKRKDSPALQTQPFDQKRLNCLFTKGALFYAEYNTRLFFYLLGQKIDGICAIDLDTIIPCYFISKIKRAKRIYDAHELFCEMKEIVSRPMIYKFWKRVEKTFLPHFSLGYTVNDPIASEYGKMYGLNYAVIRNLPYRQPAFEVVRKPIMIYQGDVNEGRGFEELIPAMKQINLPLHIYGDGNFMPQTKELVKKFEVEDKVFFGGKVLPHNLRKLTQEAYIGVNLVENNGLSYYLSLSNRFFDYIQAGLPQVCVDFPAYRQVNDTYQLACMIENCDRESIAIAVNELVEDKEKWNRLHTNAMHAAEDLNWEKEEERILNFYIAAFGKAN